MSLGAGKQPVSQFPTTAWTIVAKAGDSQTQAFHESLASLCASYWNPIYVFIQRKGFSPEDARDCTQEFFTRVIEKQYLRDVDRSKGRFRSFLLAAVVHFLSNRQDAARAQKRGGGRQPLSLDERDSSGHALAEPAHFLTPEAQFEYQWAVTTLDRTLARLQADYSPSDFPLLKPFLLGEARHGEISVAARQLSMSPGALKVSVHRMRKRYRQLLRAEIAQTVSEPAQIEEEIRYLVSVLARGGSTR
jgi:DNA-directed RNA polymerase specialized sigma24 family protein